MTVEEAERIEREVVEESMLGAREKAARLRAAERQTPGWRSRWTEIYAEGARDLERWLLSLPRAPRRARESRQRLRAVR